MISNKLPSARLLAVALLPLSVSPAQAAPLSQQEQLDQSRAQEAARQERLQFPKQKAELYLGLDVGAVYGADLYNGHVLAGAALGVRGTVNDISYDVFAAASIEKPEGFHTPDATCGFSLGWRF